MLSILCVRLTIKVKVGIPESFKVGWYPPQKTGSSHLKNLHNNAGGVTWILQGQIGYARKTKRHEIFFFQLLNIILSAG